MTPKECVALRALTTGAARSECPGCFPRYYYYSNFTKACYFEYVEPLDWDSVLSASLAITDTVLENIKALFLQGVAAIKLMRKHNIEHHDLTFRNMMVHQVEELSGTSRLQLVLFDLAGSLPLNQLSGRRLGQNGKHTDLYMLACDFMQHLYYERNDPLFVSCFRDIMPDLADVSEQSFMRAFVSVMRMNANHSIVPDYQRITSIIKSVKYK